MFAKALRRFATCLLVNNNLWGKLVSSSPIIFDYDLKTSSDSLFVADFSLLRCEFDRFAFNSNLGGPFRASFWGGGGRGGKITPCLKLVRNMLETSNLARKYTPVCNFREYTF